MMRYPRERVLWLGQEAPAHLLAERHRGSDAAQSTGRFSLQSVRLRLAEVDYEYRRNGTDNVFTTFQPRRGWKQVEVTTRRASPDFAEQMRRLVDEHFPQAETIRVVLDNLSTHTPSALYETFPPTEMRRLTQKLEFHDTPKHGSWLNMVEIELSILARQCLDRRLPDLAMARRGVAAWEQGPEPSARHRGLALQHRRRADQAPSPLSGMTSVEDRNSTTTSSQVMGFGSEVVGRPPMTSDP